VEVEQNRLELAQKRLPGEYTDAPAYEVGAFLEGTMELAFIVKLD